MVIKPTRLRFWNGCLQHQPVATFMMRLRITRLPNGHYLATSQDVPGLVAQGRTESEAATIAQRWPGDWTKSTHWHVCTDPSHPALVQFPGQKGLYRQILDKVEARVRSGAQDADVTSLISEEVNQLLSQPTDSVEEGYRVQGIRRRVAEEWGSVFCRLENLAYLTTWFMNDRFGKNDDRLSFVLCLLALEATRNILATTNQLRGALAAETFGYWRTLYETYVHSQFLLRFSAQDPDLPERFAGSTISMYLDFYERFGPSGDKQSADHSWGQADEFYTRYHSQGKGNYGWAHPCIAKRKPTFRDLANTVDEKSKYLDRYYDFATSKTHGRFILGFDGIRPARGAVIGGDSFSSGGVDLVLEFTIPLFMTVVENAVASSATKEHEYVLNMIRTAVEEICKDIASIKSNNLDQYG